MSTCWRGRGLAGEFLEAAPRVKILVTSRARLNLQAEQLLPVAGMDVPDCLRRRAAAHGAPARHRRVQRGAALPAEARRVRPGYEPTPEELSEHRRDLPAGAGDAPGHPAGRGVDGDALPGARSPPRSGAAWTFWRATPRTCRSASAACARPSSTPGACWARASSRSWPRSRSSAAASPARRRTRSAGPRCATCAPWPTGRSCRARRRGATRCTSCCGSTPRRSWRSRRRLPRRCASAMPTTMWPCCSVGRRGVRGTRRRLRRMPDTALAGWRPRSGMPRRRGIGSWRSATRAHRAGDQRADPLLPGPWALPGGEGGLRGGHRGPEPESKPPPARTSGARSARAGRSGLAFIWQALMHFGLVDLPRAIGNAAAGPLPEPRAGRALG